MILKIQLIKSLTRLLNKQSAKNIEVSFG